MLLDEAENPQPMSESIKAAQDMSLVPTYTFAPKKSEKQIDT